MANVDSKYVTHQWILSTYWREKLSGSFLQRAGVEKNIKNRDKRSLKRDLTLVFCAYIALRKYVRTFLYCFYAYSLFPYNLSLLF